MTSPKPSKVKLTERQPTAMGDLLSLARELKGITLRELARRSGVSNALISQIEMGAIKNPGFHTVVSLADALGLSLDRIAKPHRRRLDVLRKSGRAALSESGRSGDA